MHTGQVISARDGIEAGWFMRVFIHLYSLLNSRYRSTDGRGLVGLVVKRMVRISLDMY